ncbi:MAG: hypothetical protein DRH33_02465 [Candidatus Nealsonbacteria bacterium]|nr:MAG: hypothetical protein DRH33_02465 [Candidatus Nealsonbacteria bacterium]
MLKLPVYITSGYPCLGYNHRIRGVPNSNHCNGLTTDIKVKIQSN